MQSIQDIAAEIVAREGGYVNDPADPGGATKYGVTIHSMRRLGLDLDGNGRVNTADVRRLTRAQAVEIFLRDYYEKPGIAGLPEAVQPPVFDMQVNAGANAVKILQRMLTQLGWPLVDDGMIGPKTRAAADQAEAALEGGLADEYGSARRDYYYALADARPASRKYVLSRAGGKGGWITRAEAFMSPARHLTLAQHRARCAGW
ncbi:MAG: holin-associated N-acetylmuramidase [Gemmobacter sp.]|nr:holin-associated N-acetylmuramidase [Gemmobacter sp.]